MARNVTVTYSDGTTAVYQNVPDEATPEEVTARASADAPGKAVRELDGGKGESGGPSLPTRVGASLTAGYGKAATSVPQLLMAPANAFGGTPLSRHVGELTKVVQDFYENIGQKYGIQNPYGKAVTESIGGGVAFGGVSPTAVVSSAGAGVGSEAAAQTLGDNFVTRLLGGLAGGIAGGAAATRVANVRPQTGALAREVTEGVTDDMLEQAQRFQAEAASRGVSIDLAQALKSIGAPTGNIEALRNFLANKKQGNQVQQTLQAQPSQASRDAQRTVNAMPGHNFGETQSANNLQEAATGAINAAKQQRSDAVRELYARAQDLAPEARGKLAKVVEGFLQQPGIPEKAQAAGRDFLRKLSGVDEQGAKAVEAARVALAEAKTPSARAAAQRALAEANAATAAAGTKPLRALDVDTWISELVGPFKGTPLNPVDPKTAGNMKRLGTLLNREFQTLSPEVRAAEAKFAQMSDEVVNPLKQSVTGRMATPRGYRPDVEASVTKFKALLDRGVDSNSSVSEVIQLGRSLQKVDKTAFQDALKSHLSARIKEAVEPGGVAAAAANNENMAAKLANSLWKNEAQAQGLRDAVSLVASQNGKDPVAAVAGLNRMIQITQALRSRPTSVGGLQPKDLFELGSKTYGADALRVFGFLPFEKAARKIEDAVLSKTLTQFDEILTSPQGAETLVKLAKLPPSNRTMLMFLANLGSQGALQTPAQSDAGQQ